jgi:hypothetical protein
VCIARGDSTDPTLRLHLTASAGRSADGSEVWRRLDGEFHRFDMGDRRVGHIASDGAPVLLQRGESSALLTRPEWLKKEGIASFAGHPLTFNKGVIGVIGVFSRRALDDGDLVHLRWFAEQCAVAIASVRVVTELEGKNRVLADQNAYLLEEIASSLSPAILGTSSAIQRALDQARLVAGTESTVFLLGESGTGKELFAHEVHPLGVRRERPLIKVNCGPIPHELFESEFSRSRTPSRSVTARPRRSTTAGARSSWRWPCRRASGSTSGATCRSPKSHREREVPVPASTVRFARQFVAWRDGARGLILILCQFGRFAGPVAASCLMPGVRRAATASACSA